jgi:hypothetical protein
MQAAHTSFANHRNPWTGQAMTKDNKPKAPAGKPIDLKLLSICDDEMPTERAKPVSKYEPLFSKMKIGQAIKCPAGSTAAKLANSLRTHADRHGIECVIKTMSDYGDGFGRVWLLAKDAPKLKRAA